RHGGRPCQRQQAHEATPTKTQTPDLVHDEAASIGDGTGCSQGGDVRCTAAGVGVADAGINYTD
ncbi:MAG: hypothetical protein VX255_08945, partial [Candidatus Latescibacterota bacterium]|nr:hypothetical protein [Candidatus Latescibacterota bacterium]